MKHHPGFDIEVSGSPMRFRYGSGVFGPEPEYRRLDSIRASLLDPDCDGPDPVYGIVMDVGRIEHRAELHRRRLLFGVVAYARGRLGEEPVRSQGHVHKIAGHSGWSPPEVFEIWSGRALIYAQERAEEDAGRCIAVEAAGGDLVVVPPGWAHAVISADPREPLIFGAWCDRDYGFVYDAVRAHQGLAWFPRLDSTGAITWVRNPSYRGCSLEIRRARKYPELGLRDSVPLYRHLEVDADAVQWVSDPARLRRIWDAFEP